MRRLEWTYAGLVALRWLPVGLWFPLAVLVERERGLSLAEVGLVGATYSVTVIVLELPTGGLADAWGRKRMLLAGTAVSIVWLTVFVFARSVPAFLAVAVLHGVERALRSGPLQAWFVDAARHLDPQADLTRGLARGAVANGGGLAVGALAAGLLPVLLTDGFAGPYRLLLPTAVAVAVEVAHLLAIAVLLREPPAQRQPLASVSRAAVRLAVRSRAVRNLMLGVAAIGLVLSALELLAGPRLAELLGGTERTEVFGFLWAGGFSAAAVGSALTPVLLRLHGGRVAHAAATGMVAGGLTVIALAALAAPAPTIGLYGLVYLLVGAVGPLHSTLLHKQVPSGQRATMLSVDSLAQQAGATIGSLTLPFVADRLGIGAAWMGGGAVLALSALLYLSPSIDRHERLPEPVGGAAGAQR
jgi:MFS family permease